METLRYVTILLYLASTAGYLLYLFLQKDGFHRAGFYLLIAGAGIHSLDLLVATVSRGQLPATNLYESLSIAAWAIAVVFLVIQSRYKIRILGIFAAPLAAAITILAIRLPAAPAQTQTIFDSIWFTVHIVSVFIGEAALALACGVGLLYLLQEHAIKQKKRGFFYSRLPSLELLDATGYACIVVGFTMLTIGLITGFVYAKAIWGRFWSWDPKEVWSGITWILYAVLLHERLAVGWRGRRAAIMAIIGFCVVLFTFIGVNFFMTGHHGQFTKF